MIVYKLIPPGPSDHAVVACIHGKARGEAVPFHSTGSTVDEAKAKLSNRTGVLLFECDAPPAGKLRFLAVDPALKQFYFAGETEEKAVGDLHNWWDFVNMCPRASHSAQERRSGDDGGKGAQAPRRPQSSPVASANGNRPEEIVAAIRSRKYKSQMEIAAALGLTQPEVSIIKRRAITDGLIKDDEVNAIFKEVKAAS